MDLFAALKPKPTARFGALISAFEVLKLVFDLFVNVFFPRDSKTVIKQIFKTLNNCDDVGFLTDDKLFSLFLLKLKIF